MRPRARTVKSAADVFDNLARRRAGRVMRAYFKRAEAGDTRAGQDLLNRIIGPAPQRLEVSGPNGSAIQLQQAAPLALSLMTQAELLAIQAFQRRLGLEAPAVDAQVVEPDDRSPGEAPEAASAIVEPGQSPPPPSPLLLDSLPTIPDTRPALPHRGSGDNRQTADTLPNDGQTDR